MIDRVQPTLDIRSFL